MTREEILAMEPGKKLNELVMKHIFGMEKRAEGESFNWEREVDGEVEDWQPHYFSPSTDIYAVWEAEEKIKELRLHVKYCQALKEVVISTGEYVGLFDYIHATAEQRCKAALLAVLEG